MKISVKITFICMLLLSHQGFSMRCQQHLVYDGDTQYIVNQKCGEPRAKNTYVQQPVLLNPYNVPYGGDLIVYEVWTYQRSSNDFIYEVYFQDGVVVDIKTTRGF